jgi:hypothetical protein
MSEEGPSWEELRRRIPTDLLPRTAEAAATLGGVRVLAANDNGRAPKEIRVMFRPTSEPALQSAAEVFLQLLDRSPVSNDN